MKDGCSSSTVFLQSSHPHPPGYTFVRDKPVSVLTDCKGLLGKGHAQGVLPQMRALARGASHSITRFWNALPMNMNITIRLSSPHQRK